jgi:non-heme chloroperoxidase
VITYDRRGFGRSSQPASGYDYDTFAADLDALMTKLDLHEATLAGHSMGTGEVTRYLGAHGPARVARGVLISPIGPFLLQAGDNPEGEPASAFDGFIQAAKADTPAWMTTFLNVIYGTGAQRDAAVSDQAFQASWNQATAASATAAVACIATWETDFCADLAKIDVPVLVVQGDADQAVPFEKTGQRVPAFLKDAQLVTISGGPHAIPWTHAEQVNTALLQFIGARTPRPPPADPPPAPVRPRMPAGPTRRQPERRPVTRVASAGTHGRPARMKGKNMQAEHSHLVRPFLPIWRDALRDESGATFGEVAAPHVRLEGSIFAAPIDGCAKVWTSLRTAGGITGTLSFTHESTAPDRSYLEWELEALAQRFKGITVLTFDGSGLIGNVALHHRPLGGVLAFSAEMGRRLGNSLGPGVFYQAPQAS